MMRWGYAFDHIMVVFFFAFDQKRGEERQRGLSVGTKDVGTLQCVIIV